MARELKAIVVCAARKSGLEQVRTAIAHMPGAEWHLLSTDVPGDRTALEAWSRRRGLRATIIVFEGTKEEIKDAQFLAALSRFTNRASVGFGLFVCGPVRFADSVSQARELGELRDVVQLTKARSLNETLDDAASFIRAAGRIRLAAGVEGIQNQGARLLGATAGLVEVVACLTVTLFLTRLIPADAFWNLDPRVAGVVAGIPFLPSVFLPLLCVRPGFGLQISTASGKRNGPAVIGLLLLCMFVLVRGSLSFRDATAAPEGWLTLGQCIGLLLEALRRNGRRAAWLLRIRHHATDRRGGLPTVRGQRAPRMSRAFLNRVIPEELLVPWFGSDTASVFLSYTENSEWGRLLAREVRDSLERRGVDVFYAPESIAFGRPWRPALYRSLGKANVIVAIVDPETTKWPWPAREVEAAIQGHARTGLPKFVVLTPTTSGAEDADSSTVVEWNVASQTYPVFDHLVGPGVPTRRLAGFQSIPIPHGADDRREILESLGWGLVTGRFSTPGLFNASINRALKTAAVPAVGLAMIGMIIGVVGLALVVLGDSNGTAWRATSALVDSAPIFLVLAFSFGYCARSALSWWLEVAQSPWAARLIRLGSLIGISVMMAPSIRTLSPLRLAWAGVLCAIGWWVRSFTNTFELLASSNPYRRERAPALETSAAEGAPTNLRDFADRRAAQRAAQQNFEAAKESYEEYVRVHGIAFESLTEDQTATARADVGLQRAERGFRDALRWASDRDERYNAASTHAQLGLLLHLWGSLSEAGERYKCALSMLRGIPILLIPQITNAALGTEVVCCDGLGLLRLRAGETEEALNWFRRSRVASGDGGSVWGVLRVESIIAGIEVSENQKQG